MEKSLRFVPGGWVFFYYFFFQAMRQWHCYLKLIMPSAKAAVSQIAFVAVDHWRGDPSSCFLLLSAPGASVPLWQRACLCYASSSPSLRALVVWVSECVCVCVCVCVEEKARERERERESVCPCAELTACAGSSAWFMRRACVCARSHAGIAAMFALCTQQAHGL